MEKSSEEIPERKIKTRYSAADYQFTINPLSPRWVDLLIKRIDRERGQEEIQEIDAGIVFLKRGQSRWGFTAPYHGLWIVTVMFPNNEIERVAVLSQEQAKSVLDILKARYNDCAFCIEPEEYFMLELNKKR
jgi:hypothetical protein